VHEDGLGDLEDQPVRLQPGVGERRLDLLDDLVVGHLPCREVHRHQEVLLVG
jgi:hypothetical protein